MLFPISFETISSQVWWPSYSQHLKRPPGSYRASGWEAHSSVTLHWGLLTACQALLKHSWRFEGGVVLVRPHLKCVPSMALPSMREIQTLAELANGRVGQWQSHPFSILEMSKLFGQLEKSTKQVPSQHNSRVVPCFWKCSQRQHIPSRHFKLIVLNN